MISRLQYNKPTNKSPQRDENNNNNLIQIPFVKENEFLEEIDNPKMNNSNISTNNLENKIINEGTTQNASPYENLSLKEKFFQLKGKNCRLT